MDFSTCSKRYITRTDDNQKPLKNIANNGLEMGERAKVTRHGEYNGIEIEAVDKIYPLFTSERINKIYQMLLSGDINSLINYAHIQNEYMKYGNDVIHYLIKTWCEKVHVSIPNDIDNVDIGGSDLDELNLRITTNVSHELVGKIKLTGVGSGEKTGEPILPLDWIGRIFKGAEDLHREMDKLPSRLGKPPVTYCCTYGMIIQSKQEKKINLNSIDNFFVINKTKFGLKSRIINKSHDKNTYDDILKNSNKYLQVSFNHQDKFNAIILVENGIITKNFKQNNFLTSYLCSLLQKCFRNNNTQHLLEHTIINLHYSRGYNLPDQHFAKVSGPKQLCWRSYISIIEDVDAYVSDVYIDLLDLLILSLVFNELPDMQLEKDILKQFQYTMNFVQNIKTTSNWRNYKEQEFKSTTLINSDNHSSRIQNSILIANLCVNMMSGDRKMLGKFYNYVNENVVNIDNFTNIKQGSDYDYNVELDTRVIAFDMHCYPSILIELQGSLPFIPTSETLQMLSSFIWDNSSSYNTRYKRKHSYINTKFKYILRSLIDIQHYHIIHNPKIFKQIKNVNLQYQWILKNPTYANVSLHNSVVPENIKRISFLLIFGRVYRLDKKIGGKVHNIIICGDLENITKVKLSSGKSTTVYIEGKDRFNAEKEFINQFQKDGDIIDFKQLVPPVGWKWKDDLIGKQKLSLKLISSNEKNLHNTIEFYVGKYKLEAFDGSPLLEQVTSYQTINNIPEYFEELLRIALYNENGNIYENLLELHEISKIRLSHKDFRIFESKKLFLLQPKILLYVRARILMSTQSTITIGPCDRGGNKTNNSISYQYEGVIWRILIVLSALYPCALKSNTLFNYTLDKSTYAYSHMMSMLDDLVLNTKEPINFNEKIKLKTPLWDHQSKSVNKIVDGFYVKKNRGFGDASGVGTGKTLVALSVIIELYNNCKKDKLKLPHKGFLVMLPTEILYDTWKEEINKHTVGLDMVEQFANGTLSGEIKHNTVVITTMGRCRDHPLLYQWLLVIIDECLTVQNKEALQTEEAWRQSSYSYFGVLMLSATFFRSRFDKMTYMLNMLNDTLPKTNDYLDTILAESIVCNLNENEKKWTTNINYFELDQKQKIKYSKILANKNSVGVEQTYTELQNFIRESVDYISLFESSINKITQKNPSAKILIYAHSKIEADSIANKISNVSRFSIPLEKTNSSHIVVSYAEGTFGLNNLTDYNTILTRPPEPDKLPQMKGRLDRPAQQASELHLEYIVIKDTIEEAGLVRLEICKNFYGNYIMPLAEFFNVALEIK
jgi:hypothetical protein